MSSQDFTTAPQAYRNVTFRLIPGTKARARKVSSVAGANRFTWNRSLAANRDAMTAYRNGEGEKPSVSAFSLFKWFTQLRQDTPWLQELPCAPVRYVLKYQADAWKRAFNGGGFPKFKRRRGDDSFTIPDNVRIRDGRLWIPKILSLIHI